MADTDDLRHSPALAVAARLAAGAQLTGYDPAVWTPVEPVEVVEDPYLVAKDAPGVVLLTEWPTFRELDCAQLMTVADRPIVMDARNPLDRHELAAPGIRCIGIGMPP
jgi:UDPglucose 6-dehydrogenase